MTYAYLVLIEMIRDAYVIEYLTFCLELLWFYLKPTNKCLSKVVLKMK